MEKFDLKTAVHLLPVMTGEEDITKKLIDSIELYKSMLDQDSIPKLVNFILGALVAWRFTDGLRNPNLGLILSARNLPTLKDAIQAAKDEEISSIRGIDEPSIFVNQRGFPGQSYHPRAGRGFYSPRRGMTNNMDMRYSYDKNRALRGTYAQNNIGRGLSNPSRGFYRGRSGYSFNRGYSRQPNIYVAEEQETQPSTSNNDNRETHNTSENPSYDFFRP
ncbi:uncharacterized protein LOC133515938 [Cydia pomonella]|uniref:uncharacterized protein LOC133515938 n=1 Tax=Cydia pomonella TaxID=82600 RepID=UPI002ADDB3F5|nr:uncharacterized protein LOC133515938 [Cydia pomonella]